MACSFNVLHSVRPVDKSVGETWQSWVPAAAQHYLLHTEGGEPIRVLARRANIHASTVLRQVRRFENRRGDPLVDGALEYLARRGHTAGASKGKGIDMHTETVPAFADDHEMSPAKMRVESQRVLRRMVEPGAVLAIACGMEMGVIVRDTSAGETVKTATVERRVAQFLALNEMISCDDPDARICRYRITATGRSELRAMMAAEENGAHGFAEGQARFAGPTPVAQQKRTGPLDSPLLALARRRDKDGTPFLSRDLLAAGERLREDFELAQMAKNAPEDWGHWLETGAPVGQSGALERVAEALNDLGDGLGEVALRCCCLLEGMEAVEGRMGWSARSGKIVLRIALQQLKRHYDSKGAALIG